MSEHIWVQERIAEYVAGGLDAQEAERLEVHARDCLACGSALAAARQLDGVLSDLFADVRPDPGQEDRAVARLRAVPPRPALSRGVRWALAAAAVLLLGLVGGVAGSLASGDGLWMPGDSFAAATRAEKEAKSRQAESSRERRSLNAPTADGHPRGPNDPGMDASIEAALPEIARIDKQTIDGAVTKDNIGTPNSPEPVASRRSPRDDNPPRTEEELSLSPPPPPGAPAASPVPPVPGRSPRDYTKELHIPPPPPGVIESAPGGPPSGPVPTAGAAFDPVSAKPSPDTKPSPPSEPGSKTGTAPSGDDGSKGLKDGSAARKPGADSDPKDTGKKAPDPAPEPMRRIIIRSGDMEFEVESFDSATATVSKLVLGIKGAFVATVNSDKLPNGKVRGAITVRVPPEQLDGLVLDLRRELGKGGELKGVKLTSQDVTKMYTDLESRLKAARTMEQRLLQIIKEGKGEIKQLLEAEKELGVWRTKIEEYEGEIRYYANLAAFSTLTISLTEREIKAAAAITERERVQAGVEVEDVDKAYQQVLAAVLEAKGRITKSELKQLSAGQFNATCVFEVAAEAGGPIRDRLRMLGRVARLEIDRTTQTEGGTLPSDAKAKRGDTVFLVQLYNLANVSPRETATLQVAAPDVASAYQALRNAVAKTTGRVLVAQLNEQDRQNVIAQLDFEVRRADEGAVRTALDAAGEALSRQVTRAAETESVTDTKVLYRVALVSVGSLRTRETMTLSVEVADVDGSATLFAAQVAEAKGRQVDAKFGRDGQGRATATLEFVVPLAAAAGLVERFKSVGTVRVVQSTRDPQATEGRYATARLLVTLTNASPRETVTLQVATTDVASAYQALRDAVAKTTGRVLVAQLNEQDRQNVIAQLDFEVRRADEGAVRTALDAAGEALSRQVTRAAETESVTDTKVLYRVALVPAGRLRPRETITLAVEVVDVDGSATLFAAQVAEAKGRQVDAKLDRDVHGGTTATLVFEVPLAAAAGLVERFKGAGAVRAVQSVRDPQATEGRYATARLLVTLTNVEAIVPEGDGLWPKVRRGLSVSAAVLLTSVTWVVFGLCVVLPWAVIGFGGYRVVRRFVPPAPVAPAAPPTTPA